MKTNLLSFAVACLLLLAGCSKEDTEIVQKNPLKSYQSGTNNGFFWSLWKSTGSTGTVNYTNGSAGNYKVSWSGFTGNFTCGKGWSSGSTNRVIGYNFGVYSNSGGGTSGYYGWSRNPYYEYYVNEKWGSVAPTGGTKLGSFSSDGGTYNVYKNPEPNAGNIDGGTGFTQIYSSRTSQQGSGNHTITFGNHYNKWKSYGYTLGSLGIAAIMVTETWGTNTSGNVNVTIW